LSVADNQLLRLSHHFATLTSLRLLRVSGNNLKKLPAEIGNLQSLTYMDACHNSINKLPAEIGACTNLRHLNISFNRIPAFPNALGNLEELTYFAFDTNLIRRLPLDFRKLRQLTRLQLGGNDLKDPPIEIVKEGIGAILEYMDKFWVATRTNVLDLSGMDLRGVPAEVNQVLTNLTELDLQNNLLKKIELDQIRNLTRLTSLNIEFNRIKEIPIDIKQFTSIRQLWVGYNVLTSLPHELGALPALDLLNFESNKLERPPEDVLMQGSAVVIDYLRRMYAARDTFKLDLSAFRLRAIPPEITEFETLRELYLNENDISVFPVAMSALVCPTRTRTPTLPEPSSPHASAPPPPYAGGILCVPTLNPKP